MRRVLIAFILPFTLSAAEPSAFGAGDLSNPSPYGLTPSEKYILKNKESLEDIQKQSRQQVGKVQSIQERVDGLQTIVEGLIEKSQENRIELGNIAQLQEKSASELQTSMTANSSAIAANAADDEALKRVITELSGIVDSINSNYVAKDEYNRLVAEFNSFKKLVSTELKAISKGASSVSDGKNSAQIADEAYKLYKQKNYTKAIELYEHLIGAKYKPARAHYMIGEMYYYRNEYEKAIAYFKKSANLYDKASYMPTLLYHSGAAMEKIGDKENAIAFYDAIIAQYPDEKITPDVEKRLQKLRPAAK